MKITRRTIEALKPDPHRDVFLWDEETRGFGVRMKSSGVISFIAQTRVGRRTMRIKIGRYDPTPGGLTPEAARLKAKQILIDASNGIDAAALRRERRKGLTVAQFWDQLIEGAVATLAPGTATNWKSAFKNWIKPTLGPLLVADVSTQDILKLRRAMSQRGPLKKGVDGKTNFNRVRAQLHRGFEIAEIEGLRPRHTNPVTAAVAKFKERRRQRFLSADELKRLNEALIALEKDPTTGVRNGRGIEARMAAAVRLLIATGLRHREVLHLEWTAVDWQRAALNLEHTKTGARIVPLNTVALSVLHDMHENRVENSIYVFAGARPGKPIWSLKNVWPSVCRRAGLEGVRVHDLRHSFASLAVGQGESLFLTSKLLGHSTPTMTNRYAHLADDPVRAASQRIGDTIAAIFDDRRRPGEIVPIAEAKKNA
jgi:integrase